MPFKVAVPTLVVPEKKSTVPVGGPPTEDVLSVADSWTDSDGKIAVGEAASAETVAAFVMLKATGPSVLGPKLRSPLYEALRLWLPTGRMVVSYSATPVLFRFWVARGVGPSENVALPVAIPFSVPGGVLVPAG